ncbi:MAG: UbiA family prenyltransferase [Dehalococcoidia bacterium]|nr:UbiA family prenyltransferase [Dehalococcoidia bacterium]
MIALATLRNYLEVLKPRETILLGFIGLCSAIIAAEGTPPLGTLLLATATIALAAGGANGLTNYLDRKLDARMNRTRGRVFPTQRIHPPEKALPWIFGWIIAGLVLAWTLHPWAFTADLVGTVAAAIYRKRVACVFPQGVIASCAPVLMGWFAVSEVLAWELGLLCLLIAAWLPLHVWSVMVSHRDDYLEAGLSFFPMNVPIRLATSVLLIFALILNTIAIGLYFVAHLGLLYLVAALGLGIMMLYGSTRLLTSPAPSRDAWRLYKLSSFPYLGLIFLAIVLDVVL